MFHLVLLMVALFAWGADDLDRGALSRREQRSRSAEVFGRVAEVTGGACHVSFGALNGGFVCVGCRRSQTAVARHDGPELHRGRRRRPDVETRSRASSRTRETNAVLVGLYV